MYGLWPMPKRSTVRGSSLADDVLNQPANHVSYSAELQVQSALNQAYALGWTFVGIRRSVALDDLAADFASRMSGSMDIDVPLPGHQFRSLGIRQVAAPSNGLALGVIGTTTPAFLSGSAGPWKWAIVAGPERPE